MKRLILLLFLTPLIIKGQKDSVSVENTKSIYFDVLSLDTYNSKFLNSNIGGVLEFKVKDNYSFVFGVNVFRNRYFFITTIGNEIYFGPRMYLNRTNRALNGRDINNNAGSFIYINYELSFEERQSLIPNNFLYVGYGIRRNLTKYGYIESKLDLGTHYVGLFDSGDLDARIKLKLGLWIKKEY